jgi:hypothetical protein
MAARQLKAAQAAERGRRAGLAAGERKAALAAAAAADDDAGAGGGAPTPTAAPAVGRTNFDELPVSQNHRGQPSAPTEEEVAWRRQQQEPGDAEADAERARCEGAEEARVAAVRSRRGHAEAPPVPSPAVAPPKAAPALKLVTSAPGRNTRCEELEALRGRWGQLGFLLRQPQDDLEQTRAAVDRGAGFIAEVEGIVRSHGVRGGAVLQWVLPFDNNTSLLEQWNVRPQEAARERSTETQRFADQVGEPRRAVLRAAAAELRGLVRIKLADDQDIEQARAAVGELHCFFGDLATAAKRGGLR